MFKYTALSLIFLTNSLAAAEIFKGSDGLVIIEAESTSSSKGKWKKKTSIDGFSGESHLEFTGNKPSNGPPKSPLKYRFSVDKDGDYKLMIRAHKRLDGARHDLCNDCYVKLKGDFDTGSQASLKILKSDNKLFGGSEKGWGWTSKLDVNHKKYQPIYKLKAGETYQLTISGRSQRFNMDRIIFKHSSVKDKKAKDSKLPESST